MFEYHGWLSTFENLDKKSIEKSLKKINNGYPVSVEYVNGKLHISFSGNPNRNLGQVEDIAYYLCELKAKMSGCIYINDSNSKTFDRFYLVKIVEDTVTISEDKNFTIQETRQIFE